MRSMRVVLIGVIAMLVSCGGGSSSTTSDASSTSTDAGAQVVYKVGDTGPGGGIIIYVGVFHSSVDNSTIGAMCMTDTCHYLEMAATDLSTKYPQTEAITAAEAFSTATADDWQLPSLDALNEMCKYAFGDTVNVLCNDNGVGGLFNSVGGFSSEVYMSSSKQQDGTWFGQYFADGHEYPYLKLQYLLPLYVRPVRAF